MSTTNSKPIIYQYDKSATLYAVIIRLNDMAFFDAADGKFRVSPATGYMTGTEITGMEGNYKFSSSAQQWAPGDYVISFYLQAGGSPATISDQVIETIGFAILEDKIYGGPIADR